MKKFLKIVVAVWIAVATTGCGTTMFNSVNSNTSLTNVELSRANYRIVKNVEGLSSATYIIAIGGLSRKAVRDNAVAEMIRNAKLTGSQALINVHVKNHVTTVLGIYTRFAVVATAQVIEFLPEASTASATVEASPNYSSTETSVQITQEEERSDRYAIGDMYDDGKIRGYVFEVSTDGKHGKIVYPDILTKASWCTKTVQSHTLGATNTEDGEKNMKIIQSNPGWQTNYPAFAACSELGANWYLPARQELLQISKLYKVKTFSDLKYTNAWTSTASKEKKAETLLWKNTHVTEKLPILAVSKF